MRIHQIPAGICRTIITSNKPAGNARSIATVIGEKFRQVLGGDNVGAAPNGRCYRYGTINRACVMTCDYKTSATAMGFESCRRRDDRTLT